MREVQFFSSVNAACFFFMSFLVGVDWGSQETLYGSLGSWLGHSLREWW